VTYWDTSALVKLYIAETDSPYFLRLIAEGDEPIVCSAIATTEVLCVLYRKERARALRAGGARRIYAKFDQDVRSGRILTVPYGQDVEAQAEKLVKLVFARPRPILIRSLDVIHVSTALSSRSRDLVATDTRLREVAILAGLSVLP
jgi:predicted nucleic acid-binding protein